MIKSKIFLRICHLSLISRETFVDSLKRFFNSDSPLKKYVVKKLDLYIQENDVIFVLIFSAILVFWAVVITSPTTKVKQANGIA